jgi:hypothetical protein
MGNRSRWIRGFLLAVALAAVAGVAYAGNGTEGMRLTADLSGAQEVPPADPDGSGKADLRVDVEGGQVCFDIKFDDINTPDRAHIHRGAAGTNGGIVVTFWELRIPPAAPGAPASDPRNDELEAKQRLDGCVSADPALLAEIAADPSAFYVNVHNSRFPGGAIRCQIES